MYKNVRDASLNRDIVNVYNCVVNSNKHLTFYDCSRNLSLRTEPARKRAGFNYRLNIIICDTSLTVLVITIVCRLTASTKLKAKNFNIVHTLTL
jgi:hypothetical protein